MHMSLRRGNLLALHSDLLGAHALGVGNVFTVMGDVPLGGDYPQATAVSDVTASEAGAAFQPITVASSIRMPAV